ncbi:HTH CENPB-type domain-containing protein [Fusarium sp. LHS14.1]|nr:HTH CENPB-type domain-containing protein [Fusarium sp. LHS14.1]KAI8716101.1 HTH CENPB-type domain-containing protein [Fusarium sp. LHS14.1]
MVPHVYTEDDVAEAIFDVTDRGLSQTEAAQKRGVPQWTISRRLSGQASRNERIQAHLRISKSQEDTLLRWVLRQESLGYAPSHSQLRACVEAILQQQGDNKPLGKHWTTRFVKRHPQLSTKLGKRQEAARFDGFTSKAVNWYFDIRENEYGWIKPENTVNVDEGGIMAGFGLDSLVIGSSDPKKKAILKGSQSRRWTSFIEAVTATGRALKPGIIFKGKELQKQWFLDEFKLIADWYYITSPNGWTDNHIALEWLKDVYLPQTEPREASDARLIILDGHGSHAQDEWMATCFLNNVYCCYLPAHCSHGLQPLDNGIFNVIKGAYRKELQKLASLTDSAPVDKVNFVRAYAKAREAGMRKEVILSGWRFTGNWPINRRKALAHPEIQPDKEKVVERFKTPSPPQLHSDDTPKTSRQVRDLAKHRSRLTRRKYSKIAKGLGALEMKVAIQNARITGLEEQVSQLRRGKKRKAVPNPNRRFMALAEALAAEEALPNSKEAEIEVDMDEEVESVIEVGVRSEDESEDFMVVIKHCQRTRSGREVKKPRRE